MLIIVILRAQAEGQEQPRPTEPCTQVARRKLLTIVYAVLHGASEGGNQDCWPLCRPNLMTFHHHFHHGAVSCAIPRLGLQGINGPPLMRNAKRPSAI